jgi:hypothetical protein
MSAATQSDSVVVTGGQVAMIAHGASSVRPPAVRTASLALACAGVATVALILVLPYRIYEEGYLNHVSGAWAVLADDVAHGVLYRPLDSELGYGGTRYFPLHFVLHGGLVALGLPLRIAGHLVSLLAAGLLVFAGALGLKRQGASPGLAWSGGILALASRTAVMGAAGIRGDMLPLALGVLGLALVPRTPRERAFPSAAALALAVLAKPTLLWASGGALLALVVSRQTRVGLRLSVTAAALFLAGVAGALAWSHGEMLTSFRAVGGGGGFSLRALASHLSFIRPGDLAWIFGGLGLTLVRGRRALVEPLCAAGVVCFPITLALYAGEGIHTNHFVDPCSLGALAIVSALLDRNLRIRRVRVVLVVASVLGVAEVLFLDAMPVRHGELERTAAAIPSGPDPILSEQPWVPLLAGERPFLLDAFALRQMRQTSPAVERDFFQRLDHCGFRAIVLLGKLEDNEYWYDVGQFGPGFREHVSAAYTFAGIVGAHAIYLPRCGDATSMLNEPARQSTETETINDRGQHQSRLHALAALASSLVHGRSPSESAVAARPDESPHAGAPMTTIARAPTPASTAFPPAP